MSLDGASGADGADTSGGRSDNSGGTSDGVDQSTADSVSSAMESARSGTSDDDNDRGGHTGGSGTGSDEGSSPGPGEGSMDAAAASAQETGPDAADARAEADRQADAQRDAAQKEAAAAEARASQARLEAEGRAAQRSYEARMEARATAEAAGGAIGPDHAREQVMEAQYTADAIADPAETANPETALPGTYEDSYFAQTMSGVNEGIASLVGGPVDLTAAVLDGAMWAAEKAGVPESWTPEFGGAFGGSQSIEAAMGWTGSITPESADPTKQAIRDGAEITTEVAGAVTGAALAARGATLTGAVEDATRLADEPVEALTGGAARRATYGADWPAGDIRSAVDRFAGETPVVTMTETGKRIYENPTTGIQIIEDVAGDYFRVMDPNLAGRRRYMDLEGDVPNNALIDGRQVGRTQAEYNQVTHFRIER